MANHLTPDEVAEEFGLARERVIRVCVEQSIPIYHGRIDKNLFAAVCDEENVELTTTIGTR